MYYSELQIIPFFNQIKCWTLQKLHAIKFRRLPQYSKTDIRNDLANGTAQLKPSQYQSNASKVDEASASVVHLVQLLGSCVFAVVSTDTANNHTSGCL